VYENVTRPMSGFHRRAVVSTWKSENVQESQEELRMSEHEQAHMLHEVHTTR
jgi:heme-degrading monooxygenase HmoA